MPSNRPFHIELTPAKSIEINHRGTIYALQYFEVVRAKMFLTAVTDMDNDQIAERLDIGRDVVSQWRKRFVKERMPGLEERAFQTPFSFPTVPRTRQRGTKHSARRA
jgi:hypothetical protein